MKPKTVSNKSRALHRRRIGRVGAHMGAVFNHRRIPRATYLERFVRRGRLRETPTPERWGRRLKGVLAAHLGAQHEQFHLQGAGSFR